jgi:Carboxypeptidase regulatory-like domain/TonB-dependent Receptor Plug Domain
MRWAKVVGVLLTATMLGWVSPPASSAQPSTATMRGTVTDSSGGVLPGVTVTLTNAGTRDARTAVSDERGGFAFAALFAGTYEVKAELQGFKTYEAKNIVLSPNDTRGMDIALEVGAVTEVVSVTSPVEIIQTETGAREGVIRAEQIENLSVVSRSSLELLRILPGVVSPDVEAIESVSFGGGANNTQGYTVNGIRSSNNTVALDGSSLIDIGSNNGVIVTLNNNMVQEVKVQSSNFAAEYGSGGMSVSAVTKAGSALFHGSLYDYWRPADLQASDRSNSILFVDTDRNGEKDRPRSQYQYPGGNIGGPIVLPGVEWNRNRDKAFFFLGYEVQRQKVDTGSRLGVVPTLKQRQGDFSEFLTSNGQNLGQPVGPILIPGGLPNAGQAIPGANLGPYITPLGRTLVNVYPVPNYIDPNNRYNYIYNDLEPQNRTDLKMRFDYNVTNNTKAYVRVAIEGEKEVRPRGVWWGASEVALPSPDVGENRGRSYSGNIVTVLSPTMTNEVLVSWSRLKLDHAYEDPSKMRLDNYGVNFVGTFAGASPYLPGVVPNWGGGVSNMWSAANDMFAHNDALQFSNKITKIAGAHGLKFGVSVERLQKQQNFNFDEEGQLIFAGPGWSPGSTGNAVGDILTGRLTQYNQGSRPPNGEFRFWNADFFAQDSWKVRSNLTLEFGVRAGYWTNNAELNGLGGYFDPSLYDPSRGFFLDDTFQRLNGFRYVADGSAPDGLLDNRSPFAMPRVNVAWDIDGQGNNVLRGGYGLFYNRNMGNVEYSALRSPPAVFRTGIDVFGGSSLGGGVGLNYDTVDEVGNRPFAVPTVTQDSWSFPKNHSFSISYARRIMWDQILEASYVGTRGFDLVSQVNFNAIPEGALLQGTVGNANLANPIHRMALTDGVLNRFRPFPTMDRITNQDFEGKSVYNSLQVTLSRQTGKRVQYFATYTLSKTEGTLGDEYRERDPFDPSRTYGVRAEDRTHVFNLSWNAFLPDAVSESSNVILKGLVNGWQLSGISTVASGVPISLQFSGPAGGTDVSQAYYGTPDTIIVRDAGNFFRGGLAPVFSCDPRLPGTKNGEKFLDINCIGFPAFGEVGDVNPPFDVRTPTRMTHDLTLFKNFQIRGDQKIQFRMGFFNIFNQAFATPRISRDDMILQLDTTCLRTVDNVPNGEGGTANGVCDPTGGFDFTSNTKTNFGKINLLRGHRIIELALKYYF